MDNDIFYYCDKCGRPIDNQLIPKDIAHGYNFCPDCALELYRKIFGNREGKQQ